MAAAVPDVLPMIHLPCHDRPGRDPKTCPAGATTRRPQRSLRPLLCDNSNEFHSTLSFRPTPFSTSILILTLIDPKMRNGPFPTLAVHPDAAPIRDQPCWVTVRCAV